MTIQAIHESLTLSPIAIGALRDGNPAGWYPAWPSDTTWRERAHSARATVRDGWLDDLLPALQPAGEARSRIEAAVAGGIVVTTGQQPGLFGGPLYTWFKALTALALADRLQERLSIPVAPVFWAATDDSDLAEASATIVSIPGGSERIHLNVAAHRDTPMADVRVGDASAALELLSEACGSGSSAEILRTVRAAYSPASTLGGAYVHLLREILHPLGISVLDAGHPSTRSAASPLLRKALFRADGIAQRLRERTHEIEAQGLRPQVHPVPGRTLVFRMNGEQRRRVRVVEAGELAGRAAPEELSPNVLLRPLVERVLLPTVAYVGGPAEITYFAQVSAVADALDLDPPQIVPRWSGFLLEPHVASALEELGMEINALRDPHAADARLARTELPEAIKRLLADARAGTAGLSTALLQVSTEENLPISAAAIEGAARQLTHKLDRLERRLLAAVKRRGSDAFRLLATARGALFPDGAPQERALNMIPMLARHGREPLDRVLEMARAHVSSF